MLLACCRCRWASSTAASRAVSSSALPAGRRRRASGVLSSLASLLVGPEDEVVHVGDFSLDEKRVPVILPRLHGRHVLVVGNVAAPNALRDFLANCYHVGRTGGAGGWTAKCVILAPAEPTAEIKELLINPALDEHVMYYKGSVLDEEDMLAVGADIAQPAAPILPLGDLRKVSTNRRGLFRHAEKVRRAPRRLLDAVAGDSLEGGVDEGGFELRVGEEEHIRRGVHHRHQPMEVRLHAPAASGDLEDHQQATVAQRT